MKYDAAKNSRDGYSEALGWARLDKIRKGELEPRMNIKAERMAYNQYQISKGMRAWWARRKADG